jgi:hypothetical protein
VSAYRETPRVDDITDADRYPVRVFVNGQHIRNVEMTRRLAQAYRSDHEPALPEDWTPPRMSIVHMISAQAIARNAGAIGNALRYRMRGEALAEIEAAIMGGPWRTASEDVAALAPPGDLPAFWMKFRGIPVFVDESVPWVDFEVMP